MSYDPLSGAPKVRRILTYDFEWLSDDSGACELRCATLYDGERFFTFYTIDDFVNHCLRTEYAGAWFYAHYGGRFDFNFLLPVFFSRKYECELYFNGSAVVRAEVHYGERVWSFCDSQFIFNFSLKKIGEALGFKKTECKFDAPINELVEYNQRDCEILWRALTWFQDLILELGGELCRTVAATSLRTFRRAFQKARWETSDVLNTLLRPHYVGGRVEVFQTYQEWGFEHDVNSSYPFSMQCAPLPGAHCGTNRELSDQCIARVRVRVPPCHVAPLPFRHSGTLLFPIGEFEGVYHVSELKFLEECGGTIVEIFESFHFEDRDEYGEYVNKLFKLRSEAQTEFEKLFFKLLLNSSYGKAAEKTTREVVYVNPKSRKCPHDGAHINDDGVSTCVREIRPGIIAVMQETEVPHAHLPLAMAVTSRSRVLQGRKLRASKNPAYGDTDSVYSQSDNISEKHLGGWKRECAYREAIFAAPKGYSYFRLDGNGYDVGGRYVQKFKGFPPLSRQVFLKLIAGEGIETTRMRGVKGTMKKDVGHETSLRYLSRACYVCGHKPKKGSPMWCPEHGPTVFTCPPGQPKRIFERDGTSRPFHIYQDAAGLAHIID